MSVQNTTPESALSRRMVRFARRFIKENEETMVALSKIEEAELRG